jgi:hypothetical protein
MLFGGDHLSMPEARGILFGSWAGVGVSIEHGGAGAWGHCEELVLGCGFVGVSGCHVAFWQYWMLVKGKILSLGSEFGAELKDRWHYWKLAGAFLASLRASQSFKLAQSWHVRKETLLKVILMV